MRIPICFCLGLLACLPAMAQHVGDKVDGGIVVSTQQLIRPAGQSVEFNGRPVDCALSTDKKTLFVKDNHGLVVVDVDSWRVKQELPMSGTGGSMHGIVAAPDSMHVYLTSAHNLLFEGEIDSDGTVAWSRMIDIPKPRKQAASQCAGMAITRDGKTLLVCMSMNNALGVVDLEVGKVVEQIETGVAPYDVEISSDQQVAYVSNFGGAKPQAGAKGAKSAGTDVAIDARGIAVSGTVSVIDLASKKSVAEIPVGLHPSDLQLSGEGAKLYVANANSDSVSVIDTASRKVTETINVRPDAALPFGSASNALALSEDGKTLFVANGGNNAIAVVSLGEKSSVSGFIPVGWYPGAVLTDRKNLFVANIKGVGSRNPRKQETDGWRVNQFLGTVNKIPVPTASELAGYTQQAMTDARVPQSLRAWEKGQSGVKPVPVPKHVGEPSVFEHVVYVIKENRTYDQVLGDMPRGNNDPNLCVFGKEIAPNHHALAGQFALLDNFYCNGVVSADGHAWATEGNASDFWEKSFGGFTRIYFEGDPLTVSSSGFIWDNALLHNLSFRNYGEKVFPETEAKFAQIYDDFVHHTHNVMLNFPMSFEVLRPYTCPDYPGWNLRIPDVLRMQAFLKEFAEYEKRGDWPSLVMVYLPQDHTAGVNPNFPTPAAMVADNDLALGQLVEAISHSQFWPTTCIFVIEDDPQAGFDHVDGHRSLCLVASPYTKRQQTISAFYNQTSVLHTMEQMLGLPPMNQMDAMAPLMNECFTDTADLRPYDALKNNIPLDQMNTPKAQLRGAGREFADLSEKQDLDMPDQIDDDAFNRVIWFATKPKETYPAALAGAHGRGLKSLHLTLDRKDDDD